MKITALLCLVLVAACAIPTDEVASPYVSVSIQPKHRGLVATTAVSPVGFAENTTGGNAGLKVDITSLADSGSGTLREFAEAEGPMVIAFAVNGTICLSSPVYVRSDKTISGYGADITITGAGFNISGQRNIIVENLKFRGAAMDGITITRGATDVVVDHCTFGATGDGLIDITMAMNYTKTRVTVSWCVFEEGDKVMLVGASNDDTADVNLTVTIHHSWFLRSSQRLPRLRYGQTHIFNCLYEGWTEYAVSSGYDAQMLVEYSTFNADQTPYVAAVKDPVMGSIRSTGNAFGAGAYLTEQTPEAVPPNSSTWYACELDENTTRAALEVVSQAGWRRPTRNRSPPDTSPPEELVEQNVEEFVEDLTVNEDLSDPHKPWTPMMWVALLISVSLMTRSRLCGAWRASQKSNPQNRLARKRPNSKP